MFEESDIRKHVIYSLGIMPLDGGYLEIAFQMLREERRMS